MGTVTYGMGIEIFYTQGTVVINGLFGPDFFPTSRLQKNNHW